MNKMTQQYKAAMIYTLPYDTIFAHKLAISFIQPS